MASRFTAFLTTTTLFWHHCFIRTQGQATVTAFCDDFGEIRHDNGAGFGLDAERKSGDTGDWSTAITAVISDVTLSTIIRVRCNDLTTRGGFIGQVTYEGHEYYTTNPITSGYWSATAATSGSTSSLSYVQKGAGTWDTCCAEVNENAYWIWNGQDGDTMTFDFDMSLIPTTSPTEVPSEAPSDAPSEVPSVAPSEAPTSDPTEPSEAPTSDPTEPPTLEPTEPPTVEPTLSPTLEPTVLPTVEPTVTTETTEATEAFTTGSDSEESSEEEAMINELMQMVIDNWLFVAIGGAVLCVILVIILYFKCRTGKVKLYKPDMQEDDVIMTVIQQQKSKKSLASVSDVDDDAPGLFRKETRPDSPQLAPSMLTRVRSEEDEDDEDAFKIEVDDNLFQRALTQIYSDDATIKDPEAAKAAAAKQNAQIDVAKAAAAKSKAAAPVMPMAAPPPMSSAPPTMSSAAPVPAAAPIPASIPTAAPIPQAAPIPTAAPIPVAAPIPAAVPPSLSAQPPQLNPKTPPPPEPPGGVAMAVIPAAPLDGDTGQCTDCGQTKSGTRYEADGSFYCWECWKNYT